MQYVWRLLFTAGTLPSAETLTSPELLSSAKTSSSAETFIQYTEPFIQYGDFYPARRCLSSADTFIQ